MKSYDDMQRFKDKAQIKDIDFRDMSGQVLQSETVVWPIMKQLLRNQAGDDTLFAAQPVSIAQPVPVSQHALSAATSSSAVPRHAVPLSGVNANPSGSHQHSLFNAVAASLPTAEAAPVPMPQSAVLAPSSALTPPSAPTLQPANQTIDAVPPDAVRSHSLRFAAASEADVASDAGRFRQLFSHHRHDEIHSGSKTMLLKPLLEKIALCR
ncbi:cellulose biosynthesis protein BcsO [Dickeya undicola]|uniref:Cellulose biosynthesis protein BcsO n=1 Tax=Dickeya undicola TaxID=1577887 RepID=A0A3N0GBS4_9GAMM|nr:cellulose biosynthesis protein BcsO [Dickeya undicola]RNM09899.1 cellulose biosynthesis protein BcsO [Dickeya undicola]